MCYIDEDPILVIGPLGKFRVGRRSRQNPGEWVLRNAWGGECGRFPSEAAARHSAGVRSGLNRGEGLKPGPGLLWPAFCFVDPEPGHLNQRTIAEMISSLLVERARLLDENRWSPTREWFLSELLREPLLARFSEKGGGARTGEFEGCPLWTVDAVRLWRQNAGSTKGLKHVRLVPRKRLTSWLFARTGEDCSPESVFSFLSRCCVGAVVTSEENQVMPGMELDISPTGDKLWARFEGLAFVDHVRLESGSRRTLERVGLLTTDPEFRGAPADCCWAPERVRPIRHAT